MHRLLAPAAAALVALAPLGAAEAAVTFASRTTTYSITTAGADLSGSSVLLTTIVDYSGTGVRIPTLSLSAGWSSLSISGLGSTTVSYTAPSLGAAASILLTTNTPTTGTNGLSFATTYAANAAGILQTTQVSGRYALTFSSNASGFVENGNPFTVEAIAAGNY